MLIVAVYIYLDVYPALWVFHAKSRASSPLNEWLMHSFVGLGNNMREKFGVEQKRNLPGANSGTIGGANGSGRQGRQGSKRRELS